MASNRETPVTKAGMEQYDHLPAAEAVVAALVNPRPAPRIPQS